MTEETFHIINTVPLSFKQHLHQFFLSGFNHLHRVRVDFYLNGISFSWTHKNYTVSIGYGKVCQQTFFLRGYLDYLTLNQWFESIPMVITRVPISFYYRPGFIELYFISQYNQQFHLQGKLYETDLI